MIQVRDDRKYVQMWLDANPDPSTWRCYFCDEVIPATAKAHSALELNIHHLNDDHSDDRLENLTGAHRRCHARYHRQGYVVTDETRQKLSRLHKGSKRSDESRQRMSEARKGRRQGGPTVMKQCECGLTTNALSMGTHHRYNNHTAWRIS